jgi:hypothetical protein
MAQAYPQDDVRAILAAGQQRSDEEAAKAQDLAREARRLRGEARRLLTLVAPPHSTTAAHIPFAVQSVGSRLDQIKGELADIAGGPYGRARHAALWALDDGEVEPCRVVYGRGHFILHVLGEDETCAVGGKVA